MEINWFTVIAQLINFLILVWLLKRFLYKPILNAVHEREKKIADQLKDAEDKKAAAQQEKEEFKKKNEEFDQQKKGVMDAVVAEAASQKNQLIDGAKTEAQELIAKMTKAVKEAQENDNKLLAQNTQKQVFDITRKALESIASVNIEEHSARTFIEHLTALQEEEKQQFIDAFKANPIVVKSAFELSTTQRDELTAAISNVIDTKVTLEFITAPEIISGIELSTKGFKLAWSFSEYLNALNQNILGSMKEKTTPKEKKKADVST